MIEFKSKKTSWNEHNMNILKKVDDKGENEYYSQYNCNKRAFKHLVLNIPWKLNDRKFERIDSLKEFYEKFGTLNDLFKDTFNQAPYLKPCITPCFTKTHSILNKPMLEIKEKSILLNENNPDILYHKFTERKVTLYKGYLYYLDCLVLYKRNIYICYSKRVYN